jgi:hypothetical protein
MRSSTYLSKESIHEPVQEASKQFVSHENSAEEITENHSTRELNRIRPFTSSSKSDTDAIQRKDEREEFPRDSSDYLLLLSK